MGWKEYRISEIGKVITGKTPPTDSLDYYNGGRHLFVSPRDMKHDGFHVTDTAIKVTDKALEKFKNQVVPPNSILYTCLSYGFGKIGITQEEVLTNQQINSVTVNRDFNKEFVFYLLRNSTPYIFSFNSGIDTPIVPKSVFEKLKLPVPPLPIQQKIAAVLSAYDDLIENNNRRIAILEKMAEEIYRKWFVRMRFPGHEKAKFHKGVPVGWVVSRIGKVCKEIIDGDWIETKDQGGSDYRLLQVSNVGIKRFVETNNYRFISEETFRKLNCSEVVKGDILLARMPDPTGRAWLVQKMPWKMVTAVDVAILRSDDRCVNKHYLIQYLNSKYHLDLVSTNSSGTTRERITRKVLSNLPILVPPVELQNGYGDIVSSSYHRISLYENIREKLSLTRDLLLSRLITGKLSVENLDIKFPPSMLCPESTEGKEANG